MSAAQLIEEVKRLSPDERERFIDSILQLEDPPSRQPDGQTIRWPDTLERAKRIVGDRVLPNLVFQERESGPRF